MAKKRKLNSKNPKYFSTAENQGPEVKKKELIASFTPQGQKNGTVVVNGVFYK